jgi:hypothetical protein
MLGLILVAALVAACSGGSTATRSAGSSNASHSPGAAASGAGTSAAPSSSYSFEPATATPAPTAALKISGSGSKDSPRFRLTVGSYRVAWTVSSTSASGCIQIAAVRTSNGKVNDEVATVNLAAKATKKGQDPIGITTAGTYYVSIASTCHWSISILPVQ